jgi:hypothetical protein
MRSCRESVFNRLTQAPAEEERNPPPFRLTIARQISNASACLAHNLPSTGMRIGLSASAAVTMITLAATLLYKPRQPGADPSDDAEWRDVGAVTALVMAAPCVGACLWVTARHFLSDSPPADVPAEDA